MMKIRVSCIYLLVLFISLFSFSSNVFADICDNEYIKDLKELAEQVSVTYEYLDNKSDLYKENNTKDTFNPKLTDDVYYANVDLISNKLYFVLASKKYSYKTEPIKLVVGSGNLELEIRSRECWNEKLRTISLKLPKYNTYSYRIECDDLKGFNLDVCDPWYQGTVTENIFEEEVSKYLANDENVIINFLKNNYLYFCFFGVLLVILVVVFKGYRKKNVLE